jgi:hypothetical protein
VEDEGSDDQEESEEEVGRTIRQIDK